MRSYFEFAGRSSLEFGICIEHPPIRYSPKRKLEAVDIPGRFGALHLIEKGLDSYTQIYECAFFDETSTSNTGHRIKNWIYGAGTMQRLEDSYDPDYFTMALFQGPLDIEDKLKKIGKFKLKFLCDPRSFLKMGEDAVVFTENGSIKNHWQEALPIITVYGQGAGIIGIGGKTVELLDIGGKLVLDCERKDAWREQSGMQVNANGGIRLEDFPSLTPGENDIVFSGGVAKIELIPRWWEY